jgi:hypothetical protein
VQWATGAVGLAQLREVVDRPDLELVGLFVYDPAKVGVDAGTLVDRAPTGVVATNDKAAILALDADVVLHAASKAFAANTNTDDIVALLASGTNVITTTSYNHLPTYGADADTRIRAACDEGGTRFHAAGEHPGFMFERLAATVTGLSQRIDRITVQEFVDCSGVAAKEMLVDLMGMGKRPEDITVESPMFRAVSVQYEQAIGATAEVLGLELDEIRHSVETGTSPRDVEVACGTLPAGTVVGQVMSWSGWREGFRCWWPRSTGPSPTTSRAGTWTSTGSSSCASWSKDCRRCRSTSGSATDRSARSVAPPAATSRRR